MALIKSNIKRKFIYDGNVLPEVDKNMNHKSVLLHYATIYPELTNASVKHKRLDDGTIEYSFETNFGTKG